MGSIVLLDLMGGVALLLWGLHMVHSGILRAFGPDLRLILAGALKNRFAAFAAGIGLTALLQDVEDLLGTFVDEGNCADLNADHFFRLTWKGDRRDRQGGARACGELYKIAPIEVECVHGRILSNVCVARGRSLYTA